MQGTYSCSALQFDKAEQGTLKFLFDAKVC